MVRTDASTQPHRRRRVALWAVLAVALGAPSVAAADLQWQADGPSSVPATVSFHDIAAGTVGTDPVVIAVGQDTATPNAAVIYRFAQGAWQTDTLDLPTGVTVDDLTQVGIGNGTGYALAASTLLTLGSDKLDAAAPEKWVPVAGAPTGDLSALAVASDGTGFVGEANGTITSFVTDPTTGPASFTAVAPVAPLKAVTGLAATGGGKGYAVTVPNTAGSTFFSLTATQSTPETPGPNTANCPADQLAGVAAAGNTALAVQGPCWWERGGSGGVWAPHSLDAAPQLHDVSLVLATGGTPIAAMAGETAAGGGAIWMRTGTGSFTASSLPTKPLRAVAVVAADNVWAAGDGGVVTHLRTYVPPCTTDCGGGASTCTTDCGGGSNPCTTCGSNQPTASQPQGSDVQVVVDNPPPKQESSGIETTQSTYTKPGAKQRARRAPRPRGRLLRNLKVRAVKHGLMIDFDLSAPAAVAIIASRGNRPLGTTKPHVFAQGHTRILLRFKGNKLPTNLRIVAKRRSAKTGAPARPEPAKP